MNDDRHLDPQAMWQLIEDLSQNARSLRAQLGEANAALAKLRSRAEWAVEVAAETGTEECGCCAGNWLDHPHEFCT